MVRITKIKETSEEEGEEDEPGADLYLSTIAGTKMRTMIIVAIMKLNK